MSTRPTWLDQYFKTILNGTAAPAATLGNEGDFYLDTSTTRLYGPKTESGWGTGVVLKTTPSRETISAVGSVDNYDTQGAALLTIAPIGPGAITLTGLLAPSPADARLVVLYAEGRDVTIDHNGSASALANRIYCPGAVDLVVAQGSAALLSYDPDLTRWFVVGRSTTAAGAGTELQARGTGGAFDAVSSVSKNGGYLSFAEGAPTTGASGQVTAACVQRAGKSHFVAGDGYVTNWARDNGGLVIMGPHPGHRRFHWYLPNGDSDTTVNTCGIVTAIQGTLGAPALATTGFLASTCRVQSTSNTLAGSFASIYETSRRVWRGDAAGRGGFYFVTTFAPEDAAAVSGARMFVGLHSAIAAATNVEPDTLTNVIGVAQLSASNNLQLINNDGAGTATKLDLGANFPANGSTAVYRLTLWCPPNESFIGYRVERLDTGDVSEGILTADLPVNTQLLARRWWRTNNATALAVKISIASMITELAA